MGSGVSRAFPTASKEADGVLAINWRSLQLSTVSSSHLRSATSAHSQVERLRFPGNYLTDLPSDLHEIFPNVELLDLSGNTFLELPATVRRMANLRTIILDNNTLGSKDALLNLSPSTQFLSLVCCGLHMFPSRIGNCFITSLDLSKTMVLFEDPNALKALQVPLKRLVVAGCQLTSLPAGIKALSLTFLDVSENEDLSFSDLDMFGPTLPTALVELRAAKLGRKKQLASLVKLTKLVKIDLSMTCLSSVMSFVATASPKLASEGASLSSLDSVHTACGSDSTSSDAGSSSQNWRIVDAGQGAKSVETLIFAHSGISFLPSGLHLFAMLTDLDVSFNSRLRVGRKDVSLTGLVNLQRIKLVGCDTLVNAHDGSDVVWFQLAKLPQLSSVELRETTELTARVPAPLLSCPLQRVNKLSVDSTLCGKGLESLRRTVPNANIRGTLRPSFFNRGAIGPLVTALERLGKLEAFFVMSTQPFRTMHTKRLQTAIWRYSFYLLAQSHQVDVRVVPPLDVAVVHLAHAMMAPADYNLLCRELPVESLPSGEPAPIDTAYLPALVDLQQDTGTWMSIKRSREAVLRSMQHLLEYDHRTLQGDISEPKYDATVSQRLVELTRDRTGLLDDCLRAFFALQERLGSHMAQSVNAMDDRFGQFLSLQPVAAAAGMVPNGLPAAVPPPDVETALMLHRATPVRHVNLLRHFGIGHPSWSDEAASRAASSQLWMERFGEEYHLQAPATVAPS